MILFKRNSQGKPIFWNIEPSTDYVVVKYGLVGTNGHIELLDKKLIKVNEVTSRIKAKRKEGYKELEELKTTYEARILMLLLHSCYCGSQI